MELLRRDGPWDGVLLAQHGAAVAEGTQDADGEFIARVRATVGPESQSASPSTCTRTCRNGWSRTRRSRSCTARTPIWTRVIVRSNAPRLSREPFRGDTTGSGPRETAGARQHSPAGNGSRADAIAHGRSGARTRHAWGTRVGLAEGYPYADVPEMGMSCLAVADGDAALAQRVAGELAASVWAAREQLQGTALSVGESVARARRANEGPVLLLDVGDNIGGGSAGDSTAPERGPPGGVAGLSRDDLRSGSGGRLRVERRGRTT